MKNELFLNRRHDQYSDFLRKIYPEELDLDMAKTVTFQVTENCNLKCSYCYQINKKPNAMSFEDAKIFIDKILARDPSYVDYIDSYNSQGVVIEFIGGEPFLEIDLIEQITDYFISQLILLNHPWKYRFRISICSNGVLYFNEKVQNYIKKHFNHLSFSISIDGNKELHDSCRLFPDGSGSYDIAIAGVKHFTETLKGYMGSKMTLCPSNIQHTGEAVLNLINLGYSEINLNCVYEEGWTMEHPPIYYKELKKIADYVIDNDLHNELEISRFDYNNYHPLDPDNDDTNWCGGNGEMISLDPKGDIYPCIRYMESSLGNDQPPMLIGNVRDGIMQTEPIRNCVNCLKNITRRSQSTDECFNCPIAAGCSWCTAYNYQLYGTPDKRATFICHMHEAESLVNVYYWNKLFKKYDSNLRFKRYLSDEKALQIIDQEELDLLNSLEK